LWNSRLRLNQESVISGPADGQTSTIIRQPSTLCAPLASVSLPLPLDKSKAITSPIDLDLDFLNPQADSSRRHFLKPGQRASVPVPNYGNSGRRLHVDKPVLKDEDGTPVVHPKIVEKSPGQYTLEFPVPTQLGDYVAEVEVDGKPVSIPGTEVDVDGIPEDFLRRNTSQNLRIKSKVFRRNSTDQENLFLSQFQN